VRETKNKILMLRSDITFDEIILDLVQRKQIQRGNYKFISIVVVGQHHDIITGSQVGGNLSKW